jgi:hypothetical protein
MGQPMAAVASSATPNKPFCLVSADPVGQPVRQPLKFLNRFFIFHLDFQDNPPKYAAVSIVIGRQWIHLAIQFLF